MGIIEEQIHLTGEEMHEILNNIGKAINELNKEEQIMGICPKCTQVFICGNANTDKTECKKFENSGLTEEQFKKQIELKKQVKEMLED